MKLNLRVNINGGKGKNLYCISVTEFSSVTNNYWLGDSPTDVMKQFFEGCGWDEEFVMDEFVNVGWVFNEDWDEDDYDGNGTERIEIDEIGVLVD
jgi:hypothetical protein